MNTIEIESHLLRVYCTVSDHAGRQALHEAIIEAAHNAGLSGATVLPAKMGYSAGGHFYSDLLNETMADRQPVVVEIVDQPDRIHAFLPALHALVQGRRLITLERAEVVFYQPDDGR